MNLNLENEGILINRNALIEISQNSDFNITTVLYKIFKNIIDKMCGLLGVIVLIPLTIFIYIANRLSGDKGPIFYTQDRIGKGGKTFKIYKYRSMVMDADKKLQIYLEENPEAKEEYKKYKKLKEDPRITKIGKLLRKTSLDEFPQFINLLKGDMSMVGPRPYLLREKDDMGMYYLHIIKATPGLTCIWQTSGRNDVEFNERLKMDFQYINEKSMRLDIKLILVTIKKILVKEGAR